MESLSTETTKSSPEETTNTSPEREARFFYGLFLRGHSLENLRRDIDVSNDTVHHWKKMRNTDAWYREALDVMLPFRKKVLAIFDSQISSSLQGGQGDAQSASQT